MHAGGHQQPVFFRHFRNLLLFSSHFNAVPPVRNAQPRDPLDVCVYLVGFSFDSTISPQIPATSSRIHDHTSVSHTIQGHSQFDLHENVSD